jgi:hypothetical protein
LNQINETGVGNYTLTIVPDGPTERLIVGNVQGAGDIGGLIRLNGADRVKIDGSFGGSGRFLRFRNRAFNTTFIPNATFRFQNDAKLDTVRNCFIEGTDQAVGTILFGTTNVVGGFGNDSNAVINCVIRDTLGNPATGQIPNTALQSSGTTGIGNDNNTFANNEVFNHGFALANLGTTAGDFWNINNNSFYQVIVKNNAMRIIQISGGANHIVSNNSIGGSNITRGGAAFTTTNLFTGIFINGGSGSIIRGNQISNLLATSISGLSSAIEITAGSHTIGGTNIADRNVIGTLTDSITSSNSIVGILLNTTGTVTVNNNLIQGLVYRDTDFERAVGVYITAGTHIILNNEIRNIRHFSNNASGTLLTAFAPAGIFINGGSNHLVDANLIHGLSSNPTTAPYPIVGIKHFTATGSTISRNRIFNLTNTGTGTGTNGALVIGIQAQSGSANYINNQISIGAQVGNDAQVFGIREDGTGTNNYIFNTIFVNGTGNGANSSFGLFRNSTSTFLVQNNLVYNKRGNISTGLAHAIGSTNTVTNANFGHNLLVSPDTSSLARIAGGNIGWNALNNLYVTGPNTNWATTTATVQAQNLFIDTLVGNLGIVTSNPEAWYANGKGIRIIGQTGDFNNVSGVRSGAINTGAVDIGSVEFTPTSIPPVAFADKTPLANDSTQFFFGSRMIAKAVWGSAGSLPSSVDVRYYSGVNPGNTAPGTTFMNAYWDMQAIGGSGYTYGLTLMQDSAVLGTTGAVASLGITRYTGTANNWNMFTPTVVNNITGFMSVSNVNAFGIFTGTNSVTNPLPVKLLSLQASASGNDVLVTWSTASEINNKGFEVESSTDEVNFNYVGFVKGANNSQSVRNYSLTDANAMNTNVGNVIYYRLKQLDNNGRFTYSNVVAVNKEGEGKDVVAVFPNPFNEAYQLAFTTNAATKALVETVDMQGKVLLSKTVDVNNGRNNVTIPESTELQAGIYFVRVTLNNQVIIQKLVKN